MKKNILFYLLLLLSSLAITFPSLIHKFPVSISIVISMIFSLLFSSIGIIIYIDIDKKRTSYFDEIKELSNQTQKRYEQMLNEHITNVDNLYKNNIENMNRENNYYMENISNKFISSLNEEQKQVKEFCNFITDSTIINSKKNSEIIQSIDNNIRKLVDEMEDKISDLEDTLSKINKEMSEIVKTNLNDFLDIDSQTKLAIQDLVNQYKISVDIISKIQNEIININKEDMKIINKILG